MAVSESKQGPVVKVSRTPAGPTLTFKIEQYALQKQIRARSLRSRRKKFLDPSLSFESSPLVVLNNFDSLSQMDLSKSEAEVVSGTKGKGYGDPSTADLKSFQKSKALSVCALTFQNMFPKINVQTVKINQCKRILLMNYNKATDVIEMRHYLITIKPKGVSKVLKKIVRSKNIELGTLNNIGELFSDPSKSKGILQGYATSDSEFEGGSNEVKIASKKLPGVGVLKDKFDRKIMSQVNKLQQSIREGSTTEHDKGQTGSSAVSGVNLVEIGPRLNLKLLKIENNLFSGEVKYHAYLNKSEQEVKHLRAQIKTKEEEKQKRKQIQQENVERKQAKLAEKRERKRARREHFTQNAVGVSFKSEDEAADSQ